MKRIFFLAAVLLTLGLSLSGCGKVGALHPPKPDGYPHDYPSDPSPESPKKEVSQ